MIQQSGGQGQGELVGIADAVRAAEAVVAEELSEGEVKVCGVEVRDIVLVFEGRVQVVKPGLQCLAQAGTGRAFEDQAGIQVEGRDGARGVRVGVRRRIVELVVGITQLGRRYEEIARRA